MALVIDAIVIGGGAAGLFCAAIAGKRGRRVALLEHSDRVGKKILISGGGRANFTNIHCRPEHFLSSNPHFSKSGLARYGPADFVQLVEKHGIPYHEKKLGQLFCDRAASDITNMLEDECRQGAVQILCGRKIKSVQKSTRFHVQTSDGQFEAPALVIATGGLSIPKMGATPFGYEVARQFGIGIRECRPALVPLLLPGYADLAGVSTEITATLGEQQFREKMLFTHHGLSGPAILQISSYWKRSENIRIDLLPGTSIASVIERHTSIALRAALRSQLPQRLADRWLDLQPPHAWSRAALAEYHRRLHHWDVAPTGTEGYEKAEVTAGGIDTDELSAKTMECRKVPGLFFIGEVTDVTGQLGGFNFQWAWSSAFSAGLAL